MARTSSRNGGSSSHMRIVAATRLWVWCGSVSCRVLLGGCARHDSNVRPFAPEANALSPELRALGSRSVLADTRRTGTQPALGRFERCKIGWAGTRVRRRRLVILKITWDSWHTVRAA